MFRNYWKTALRKLIRDKRLALIKILGLSIGMTCCMVMYVFVKYELSFDSFHGKADQIYRVVQHTSFAEETYHWSSTAYPLAEALRNDFSELALVTQTAGPVGRNFSIRDTDSELSKFEEDQVLFTDPYFWQIFDVQWLQGNPETAFPNPNTAVLTRTLAVKLFGEEWETLEVLGKIIQLNSKDALQITGVVEDPPATSSILYRMLVPYAFYKMHNPYFAGNWSGNYQGTTYIIPHNNEDIQALEQQINVWKSKYLNEHDNQTISYALQLLTEIHTESLYSTSIQSYTMPLKTIRAAIWIGIFILLIACINFINLATAQAAGQAKEVGVRKVLGGSRFQLFVQYLGENSFIILIVVLLSLFLAHLSLGQLNDLFAFFHLQLSLSSDMIAFTIVLALLVSALATVYPALVLSAFEPVKALKNKIKTAHSRGFGLRKALIVVQFAIVLMLGIGALVVYQQLQFFQNLDLGFVKEAVVTTPVPNEQKAEALRQYLMSQPGIEAVTMATGAPTSVDIRNGTSFRLPHQSETEGQEAEMKSIDLNYLDFYQLQLIAGRNFTRTSEQFDEFIVNEKLVKALGMTPEEALGQELQINEGKATIIGVVKDYYNNSLQEDISPCVLINWDYGIFEAAVKVKGQPNMQASLAQLKDSWEAVFPNGIYQYHFLDEQLESSYQMEQLILKGFNTFAVLAMLIACLGLIGLTTFSLQQRTKEIGVRKVLGATVQSIFIILTQQYLKLILLALLIAIPVANYFLDEWLAGFAHRIPIVWWLYALPAVAILLIAFLAIGSQTLKAAKQNPVDSLKYE
ncbi:ABC transporter permease [Catalinimonas niigatensis]|uniref:ABC transporter permease n=1 Tax=Catalinimonas niigatensis TaxID=1397264 RepID=UPI002665E5F8|nr:ABC transporter permease [Catalinimonas niigatensis]WPP50209.1 ABC transporter permease [Catalinimonas niigatensis]